MFKTRCLRVLAAAIVIVCLLGLAPVTSAQGRRDQAFERVREVQERHKRKMMAKTGIVGAALGPCEGKPCLLVLTAANAEHIRREIPPTVAGYPVVVPYAGRIHAQCMTRAGGAYRTVPRGSHGPVHLDRQ